MSVDASRPSEVRASDAEQVEVDYEPPVFVELGGVRDVVLGNSSSGNADANSQYYW
ncbi:hypothetical protein GCM10022243_43380 [Saccharothrix violaceirubra]|uniref:Lasso RiPP family leader peptide-containing protein n=1 Tax=Saccharothrix violaceirubra TaxID=413306 RepID=A0A7W7T5F8_9PSEU|nr:lasso RiPP family leader peptide-containing protein [Saccharothrix violaceirubra]MBB4965625.1 hypothetical protein [Saccharothrix violaceirubra]